MALQSMVKISGVNNLSDARYAAGMGVELMGFDLEENSSNYVSPEKFHSITSWVSGVKIVGEISSKSLNKAELLFEQYTLDYLQVDVSHRKAHFEDLPIPLIIKSSKTDQADIFECLELYAPNARWFLLEPDRLLTPECLNWCMKKAREFPMILGSNITPDNVLKLLDSDFQGIALRGGHEVKPGYRDFDELADVLEVLEVDNE